VAMLIGQVPLRDLTAQSRPAHAEQADPDAIDSAEPTRA
jgi:hypothetical protein